MNTKNLCEIEMGTYLFDSDCHGVYSWWKRACSGDPIGTAYLHGAGIALISINSALAEEFFFLRDLAYEIVRGNQS